VVNTSSKMCAALQKVHTTTIVIVPPHDTWPQFQLIREQYDKGYIRWPPHVNMIYPFVPEDEFENAAALLEKNLSTVAPFKVTMANFNYFLQGKKSSVVWSNPQAAPEDALHRLQSLLEKIFPHCDDLSHISKDGFHPHLSVGQFAGKIEGETKIAEFSATWKPVEFTVSEVFLLARSEDKPFRFVYKVPFNGPAEKVDIPYDVQQSNYEHQDLFVGNIPSEAGEKDIMDAFKAKGVDVIRTKLPKGYAGKHRGFGFVELDPNVNLQAVIQAVNGALVKGKPIVVSMPKS